MTKLLLARSMFCGLVFGATIFNFGPVAAEPVPNKKTAQFALHSVLASKGLSCASMAKKSGVSFHFSNDMNSVDIVLSDGQAFFDLPVGLISRHWRRSTNNKGNKGGLCLATRLPASAKNGWAKKTSGICAKWKSGTGKNPADWRFWTWFAVNPVGHQINGRNC